MSSYHGHFRKLYYAWQENTDVSGDEAVNQGSLSSWNSFIGIPIHFQEETGIVTLGSIQFRVPLGGSKGFEAPCPDDAETYGFL